MFLLRDSHHIVHATPSVSLSILLRFNASKCDIPKEFTRIACTTQTPHHTQTLRSRSTTMVRCTRKGCGKDYEADKNEEGSCSYHSGGPVRAIYLLGTRFQHRCSSKLRFLFRQVFHEGLKSWSCCKDVNKPVLDFDDFMKLPVSSNALWWPPLGIHIARILH